MSVSFQGSVSISRDHLWNGAVSGNYLFVTESSTPSLVVIDISSASSPSHVTTVDASTLNEVNGIVINGNTAYVASRNGGMWILDISTPSSPSTLFEGTISGVGGARGIDLYGSYVIMAVEAPAFYGGIDVVDVSSPSSPSFVTHVDMTPGVFSYSADVVVSGNYAYTSGLFGGYMGVFDLTTPTSPSRIGILNHSDLVNGWGIDVSGDTVVIASYGGNRVVTVDVSTPSLPAYKATLTDALIDDPRYVQIDGSCAYVTNADTDAVIEIDVSTPSSPSITDSYQDATNLNEAFGLVMNGSDLWVVCHPISGGSAYVTSLSFTSCVVDESIPPLRIRQRDDDAVFGSPRITMGRNSTSSQSSIRIPGYNTYW